MPLVTLRGVLPLLLLLLLLRRCIQGMVQGCFSKACAIRQLLKLCVGKHGMAAGCTVAMRCARF